ncbi:MAG: hypothetical protein JWO59_1867 [Chloroflexi bacterium]|jgi:hypothetical protein|nr:hypothetical protein [Chloroflexota bacterium]MDB5073899.1 hypothetical protein [Chloroflexota bacterium]
MLRAAAVIYGLVLLAGAGLLIYAHAALVLAGYLVVNGLLIAGSILFERSGYQPRLNRAHGSWQPTGERFIDPESKHLIEVRYNPKTGERDYVDTESKSRN